MKSRHLFIFLSFLTIFFPLKAQFQLSAYLDAGENNVSDGFYLKSALLGNYQIQKVNIEAGTQFDLIASDHKLHTGSVLKISRNFTIKEFDFNLQALGLINPYSSLVHEYNWGILAGKNLKHWHFKLGTNFRTYHITDKAADDYNISSDRNLHENWNLMYLAGYQLKANDNNWNIGLNVSNIDHFLINQETNPLVYLKGKYQLSPPLMLFAETWYKSAGSLNISANYFGFFIRTGLIWKL